MMIILDFSMFDSIIQFLPLAFGILRFNFGKQSSQSVFGNPETVRNEAGTKGVDFQDIGQNRALTLLGNPITSRDVPLSENPLLGSLGLLGDSRKFVTDLGRQLFNQFSARGAARGRLSPENLSSTVNRTLTGLSSQLLPLQQQAIQFATTTPEQQLLQRIAALQSLGTGFAPFTQGGTSASSGIQVGGGVLFS